jgi:hypothetical protein
MRYPPLYYNVTMNYINHNTSYNTSIILCKDNNEKRYKNFRILLFFVFRGIDKNIFILFRWMAAEKVSENPAPGTAVRRESG